MSIGSRVVAVVGVAFFCALPARAADATGKWKAEFDTQVGVQKYTFELIAFVEKLNFQGNEIPITYTGKVAGDEIKFTRKVGDFATEEFVARRVKD